MVSLVPLPLGSEIQAFGPSPMTKMLEILSSGRRVRFGTLVDWCNVPGGESAVKHILDMDNIETSNVTLTVDDRTRTTHVASASDHDKIASVKLDKVCNLAGRQVELDSVVD